MRIPALALGLAACLAPTLAAAYVASVTTKTRKPLRWTGSNCVMVRVNSQGSQEVPGEGAVAAVKRAIASWQTATAGCSYLRFELLPDSPDAVAGFNQQGPNQNVITWVEDSWEGGSHDPHAAALTTVYFIDDRNNRADGRILDADIELNGVDFRFSDSGAAGLTDIENTVAHELGHLLGLDHICDDDGGDGVVPQDNLGQDVPSCFPMAQLPAWMREVTMYNFADPGETKKRSPEADDIKGICESYPQAQDPGQCEAASYTSNPDGCALAGRRGGRGAWLLVISLLGAAALGASRRKR